MTVKQFCFACSQLVQKPVVLSFHVPTLVFPDGARAVRVILPSGVKVIVNLVPVGVAAVKGWPLKNVVLMSLADIGSPANAGPAPRSSSATINGSVRIENL